MTDDYQPPIKPTKPHKEPSIDETAIPVPPLKTGINWWIKGGMWIGKIAAFALRQWRTKTGKQGFGIIAGAAAAGSTEQVPWWMVVYAIARALQSMFLRDGEAKKKQENGG